MVHTLCGQGYALYPTSAVNHIQYTGVSFHCLLAVPSTHSLNVWVRKKWIIDMFGLETWTFSKNEWPRDFCWRYTVSVRKLPGGALFTPTSTMHTGVYQWQTLGGVPVGLRETVRRTHTSSATLARQQCRQRRPVLTFSSGSSNEKTRTSQNSLDTLDLLLNSTDLSPGIERLDVLLFLCIV